MKVSYPFSFEMSCWTLVGGRLERRRTGFEVDSSPAIPLDQRPWKIAQTWENEEELESFVGGEGVQGRTKGKLVDCPWDELGHFRAFLEHDGLGVDVDPYRVYCGGVGYGFADRVFVDSLGNVYVLEFKKTTVNGATVGQLLGYLEIISHARSLGALIARLRKSDDVIRKLGEVARKPPRSIRGIAIAANVAGSARALLDMTAGEERWETEVWGLAKTSSADGTRYWRTVYKPQKKSRPGVESGVVVPIPDGSLVTETAWMHTKSETVRKVVGDGDERYLRTVSDTGKLGAKHEILPDWVYSPLAEVK